MTHDCLSSVALGLVAELAARGTCRGEFATRGTQVFKSVFKKFLVELP